MTVVFFGHRDAPAKIKPILEDVLRELIENDGADLFYVGNQGGFDRMVRSTLKQLKTEYPQIKYAVVLAYMPTEREEYEDYDDTLFPEELADCHPRYAIDRCNRWLINRADTVVTYVTHPTGGAAKFKKQSKNKGKRVINLPDLQIEN